MSENLNESNQAVEEREAAPEAAETAGEEAPEGAAGDEEGAAEAGPEKPANGETAAAGEEDVVEEEVRRAEFSPITASLGSSVRDNLDLILGVTVPVTIELGSTEMFFRDIMTLGPGSVVRLDRAVGDPVDLLVNGEPVGRGEVVVVDERYGVRVTELCRPEPEKKEGK